MLIVLSFNPSFLLSDFVSDRRSAVNQPQPNTVDCPPEADFSVSAQFLRLRAPSFDAAVPRKRAELFRRNLGL